MNGKETFRKSTHPWIDQTQFLPDSQSEVLSQVIDNKANFKLGSDLPRAIVFDLDSTLFEVRYRTLRILREFHRNYEEEYSDSGPNRAFLGWMKSAKASELLYGITASASAAGIEMDAIRGTKLLEALNSFWFSRFFHSSYLMNDRPSAGAVDYVRKVKAMKIKVIYLSGRDIPGMKAGTIASLRHHGFPMGETESLVLKPNFKMDDAEFKRTALKEIASQYEVSAFFDNEPRNMNVAKEVCPKARLVFCHTVCSTTNAEPLHGVRKIFNFFR